MHPLLVVTCCFVIAACLCVCAGAAAILLDILVLTPRRQALREPLPEGFDGPGWATRAQTQAALEAQQPVAGTASGVLEAQPPAHTPADYALAAAHAQALREAALADEVRAPWRRDIRVRNVARELARACPDLGEDVLHRHACAAVDAVLGGETCP